MTRIDDKFATLRAQGRKAFVAYIMAGDPDLATSLKLMKGLPGAGVDVIELRRNGRHSLPSGGSNSKTRPSA